MKKILRLFRVWLKMSEKIVLTQLINRKVGLLFLFGKIVRFFFYFIFIVSVVSSTKILAGYNKQQIIVFFLIFNLVDITTQLLFRGVYHFRPMVVNGNFDLELLKPLPSYFRPIFGGVDIFDFITLVPLFIYFLFFVTKNGLLGSSYGWLFFLILFANSLFLAFALHLFVCSVCILTMEIDHLIWIYRDVTNMARFPTDIYSTGVKTVLTFIIPVVILMTVPAKVLLGLISWQIVLGSILLSLVFVFLSLKFWRYSLSRYTSASS